MAALVDYSRFDSIADDDAPAAAPAAATAPPEPQKSKMSWTNDERAAVLTMPLPPGTCGGDVHVRFTSSRVFIRVKDMGEIALDHPPVDATACKWVMEATDEARDDARDDARAPAAILTLAKASRELWPRGTFDAAGSAPPAAAAAAGGEHEGASSFTWAQEDATVSVSLGVPVTTRASDVRVRASRDELTIEITMPTGRVGAFVRRTWRPIVADETDWELEPAAAGADTKKLRVDLTIAELERWEQPFASTA